MSNILVPFQLLEVNVISAQDLAPVARSMRTYAVAWVDPDRKLSTRVDTQGHINPTWNDKFVFRVDDEFLYSDESAIIIEIYALHWFRDVHVGSVRVLLANLIPPPSRPFHNTHPPLGMRFVALQVRRSSGRPQGILNIGVAVLDSSMRSMPLYRNNFSAVGTHAKSNHKNQPQVLGKPELRRTKSDTSSMISLDAVARQQRAMGKRGKARSTLSLSEASSKSKKKKGRSTTSSMVSGSDVSKGTKKSGKGSSILSGSGLPWKFKSGKSSSIASSLDSSEPPKGGKFDKASPYVYNSPAVDPPNRKGIASVTATPNHNFLSNKFFTKPESSVSDFQTNDDTAEMQNLVSKTNQVYEFKASPIPRFRNSPAALIGSHRAKPRSTPLHPAAVIGSRKATPKNTPLHLAASKFNPQMGFGGSIKGTPKNTPLHPFGKMNRPLEYGTPRRSNLGNLAPPVMTESELGPSPSEVAAAMARAPQNEENENSTVGGMSLDESVEGLQSKLERWRTELPTVYDGGELSSFPTSTTKTSRARKKHKDAEDGLFSCFSNICGCECTIVCGGGSRKKKDKNGRCQAQSELNESYL